MENKILEAMKKAGKPVRPGEVADMIGEESKDVSKAISKRFVKKRIFPQRNFLLPVIKKVKFIGQRTSHQKYA